MKQLFLAVYLFMGINGYAQKPEAIINKASEAPVIGSGIDPVWSEANTYNISRTYLSDTPTLGSEGETMWKGLWSDTGIYILIEVSDDIFFPRWADSPPGVNDYEYDTPEVFFDCNAILEDGKGPEGSLMGEGVEGHYHFLPPLVEGELDGRTKAIGSWSYAHHLEDPAYFVEYYFPFSHLRDQNGDKVRNGRFGFDVTIIDRDPGALYRQRAVWANEGVNGESWSNMDDCGIITLQDYIPPQFVENIVLKGGDATEDGVPVQISATVSPDDAVDTTLTWSVENLTGSASINQDGILIPLTDGQVKVIATAKDGSNTRGSVIINISNQLVSREDVSLIKNGNFSEIGEDGFPADWYQKDTYEGSIIQVVDGHLSVDLTLGEYPSYWGYVLGQEDLGCNDSSEYLLSFVSWADAERPMVVTFQDPDKGYMQYGVSDHEYSPQGTSEWMFNLSTEPIRYELFVSFPDLTDETREQFLFQMGESGEVAYLDSVLLIETRELHLINGFTSISDIAVSSEGNVQSVSAGIPLQMVAQVQPADASLPEYRWEVIPGTGMATIDSDGVLTGTQGGSISVVATARDGSGVQGSLDLQVTIDVSSIVVSALEGSAMVEKDSSIQLSAEVLPGDATQREVNWSVARGTGEATIDENGLLTGVAKGTVIAMAFATDNSGASGAMEIEVTDHTGVESSGVGGFRVYPNPARDELVVDRAPVNARIAIYNSGGILMDEVTIEGTGHQFDISNYPPGMYLIRCGGQVTRILR